MQRMQAAHVALYSCPYSICFRRRQAGRRPDLLQRLQKAGVAFLCSDVRGRLSICIHRHEVGKRQTAKTVVISLICSIVCRTQHIFHGCPDAVARAVRPAFVHARRQRAYTLHYYERRYGQQISYASYGSP